MYFIIVGIFIKKIQAASVPVGGEVHNPGIDLDLSWINETRVDLPAIRRRAATLGTRRTVKKQWQAAWMCRALTCIDLTTLAGDDTDANVQRLCLKAAKPIRSDIIAAIGMEDAGLTTGAVCVYPARYALLFDYHTFEIDQINSQI